MDVSILGELDVRSGAERVAIDARAARAVLEMVALEAGEIVPQEMLVDAVWGEDPPTSAAKTLQSHVSRLRRALPPGLIETVDGGYRLAMSPQEVDAHRLDALLGGARHAVNVGNHHVAARLLDDAVTLWRGPPLVDLADGPLRRGWLARLEALHQAAIDLRIAAHLALGEHEQMVPQLEQLVAEHPYAEPLWAHLMLALHRSGRRLDALAAYDRLRRNLRTDLGVNPSAAVRELQSQILDENAALDVPPSTPASNLPTPLTSFIGRSTQVRAVAELLREHRLVTLVGPGGVGKTRLAAEAARTVLDLGDAPWADGVFFVELARAVDVGEVVADLLGQLADAWGVGPAIATGGDGLTERLAGRSALLVLDRAEELTDPIGNLLSAVLERSAGVTALVTSREPLAIAGEHRVDVEPFHLPVGADTHCEAVDLFVDRSTDIGELTGGERDAVVELCRMVDGLPLGIELLAARVGALSASELLSELHADERAVLSLERPGGPGERASLEGVLDATVHLLTPAQRQLLGRLAVFRGTFDTSAIRAMGGEVLTDLVRLTDVGLVSAVDRADAGRRLRLADTTRAYAARLLDDDQTADARRTHAAHYAGFARRASAELAGSGGATWTRRIHREAPNLRAALAWYLEHDPPGALAFARTMADQADLWGDNEVASAALAELVEVAALHPDAAPTDVAWALLGVGWPRFLSGDIEGGMEAMDGAVSRFLAAGDRLGASGALVGRGHMELLANADADSAADWYERALAEATALGDPQATSLVLVDAAQSLILSDRLSERVASMLSDAEAALRRAHDHHRLAHLYMDRLLAAYAIADLDATTEYADRAIAESRLARTDAFAQIAHTALGVVGLHRGDLTGALSQLRIAIRMAQDEHNTLQLGIALQAFAIHRVLDDSDADADAVWVAARRVSPVWPLFARRYGELIGAERVAELEARFESINSGTSIAPLPLDAAVALALDAPL